MMHVVAVGDPAAPPVVFSGGLGAAWFDWDPVVPLLQDTHRVIRFDRPGTGASPPAAEPPSLRAAVGDLARLARCAGAPVTLVAHSMAAFHAEALARIHPELVRGMVLVDPSWEPEAGVRLYLAGVLTPAYRAAGALLDLTGLARVVGPLARRYAIGRGSLRGEMVSAPLVKAVYGSGRVLGEIGAENQAYREMAFDLWQLRRRRPFPDIPLVVLTAAGDRADEGARRAWASCHAELAAMTPYGRCVELADSRHMVPFDRPDAIADAVFSLAAQGEP